MIAGRSTDEVLARIFSDDEDNDTPEEVLAVEPLDGADREKLSGRIKISDFLKFLSLNS